MCRLIIGIIVATLLFCWLPVFAKFSPEITVSVGNEIIDGFTQYELQFVVLSDGYYQAYGNSRLKYPFHNTFAGGVVEIRYQGFALNFGIWGDYKATKDETMEDFDWISSTEDDYIQLAYGVTTPTTVMSYYEANLRYDFKFSKFQLGPFIKYSKYHSEFVMNDLDQIWYIDLETGEELDPPSEFSVPGNVLYYEQDLKLPIIGMNFEVNSLFDRLDLFTSVGISPFTSVEDYDDHVIRQDSLESWNSGEGGNGLLFELGAKVNLFSSAWLTASYAYTDYSIECEFRQHYFDEEIDNWRTVISDGTQVRGVMRKIKASISYVFDL